MKKLFDRRQGGNTSNIQYFTNLLGQVKVFGHQ
jgi:hypothetical protein